MSFTTDLVLCSATADEALAQSLAMLLSALFCFALNRLVFELLFNAVDDKGFLSPYHHSKKTQPNRFAF